MDGDIGITVCLLVGAAIVTFLVRVGFRLPFPKSSGGDLWYHLHASEEIRRCRYRMPARLDGYSLDTPFDTPSLMYDMLAVLPKRWRERDFLFGPFADSIQSIAVFVLVYVLIHNPYLAFISSLAFALTPILVKPDARVFFFSPRPWAELFAALCLTFGVIFHVHPSLAPLLLAVLFGALTLLTGKFGAQALLFISIGLAVGLLTWVFPLVLLFSFFLATFISKGYYLKVLRGHAKHTNLYRTTIVKRHSGTTHISGFRELWIALRTRKNVGSALVRNPVIGTLAFAPLLPIMWMASLVDVDIFMSDAILFSFFMWGTIAFAVVLVISTRQLRFLGEAERYQNYAVLPVCVSIGIFLGSSDSVIIWLLLSIALLYSAFLIRQNYIVAFRYFGTSEGEDERLAELLTWLNDQTPDTILCVPFNVAPEITYKTHHTTVYWGGNLPASNFTREDFENLFDDFPLPKDRLAEHCRKFGAGLLLFHKRFMGSVEPSDYNLAGFSEVFKNEGFEVHRIQESE